MVIFFTFYGTCPNWKGDELILQVTVNPQFLLAVSPFLKDLLLLHGPHTCQAPRIFLPDIRKQDLECVLQIISKGKTYPVNGLIQANEKLETVCEMIKLLKINIQRNELGFSLLPIEESQRKTCNVIIMKKITFIKLIWTVKKF